MRVQFSSSLPTKPIVELLSQGHSYASIGRLVGLTGAAVKKRAKKLNLVN